MSNIKDIRTQLGITQAAFGAGIGCTQGNVHHYESGQRVPQDMAARIISFAAQRGLTLTYNDIYTPVVVQSGAAPVPAKIAPDILRDGTVRRQDTRRADDITIGHDRRGADVFAQPLSQVPAQEV